MNDSRGMPTPSKLEIAARLLAIRKGKAPMAAAGPSPAEEEDMLALVAVETLPAEEVDALFGIGATAAYGGSAMVRRSSAAVHECHCILLCY